MAAHVHQGAGGGDLRLERGAVRQDLDQMGRRALLEDARGSARVLVTQILQATRGLRLLPAVARLELGQGAGYFVAC